MRTSSAFFLRPAYILRLSWTKLLYKGPASVMPPTKTSSPSPEPLRRKRVKTAAARPSRRRYVQGALLFVTLVLVIDGVVGEKGLLETLRARRHHRELSQAIERMRNENAALREESRRLKEDPAAIESLAREELGLIRPGEMLFIIKDAKPAK
jgi:cell division protein FtsB